MEAANQHDRSQFVTCHLLALLILSGIGFYIQPMGAISLTIPLLIAVAPLPFYCVPAISNEAAKTCLVSTGIALALVLVTYAAGAAGLMWLLRDFRPGA